MKFIPLLKILATLFPQAGMVLQAMSEADSSSIHQRLANLEDPLAAKYGPELQPLCAHLYDKVRAETYRTNRIGWGEEFRPYIKLLNSLSAQNLVRGEPRIGVPNQFQYGLWLEPKFILYLASFHGDGEACGRMSNLMESLEVGVTGDDVRKEILLPLSVIDAFFAAYEAEGQGNRSKENGGSGYYSPFPAM